MPFEGGGGGDEWWRDDKQVWLVTNVNLEDFFVSVVLGKMRGLLLLESELGLHLSAILHWISRAMVTSYHCLPYLNLVYFFFCSLLWAFGNVSIHLLMTFSRFFFFFGGKNELKIIFGQHNKYYLFLEIVFYYIFLENVFYYIFLENNSIS